MSSRKLMIAVGVAVLVTGCGRLTTGPKDTRNAPPNRATDEAPTPPADPSRGVGGFGSGT